MMTSRLSLSLYHAQHPLLSVIVRAACKVVCAGASASAAHTRVRCKIACDRARYAYTHVTLNRQAYLEHRVLGCNIWHTTYKGLFGPYAVKL